MEGPISSLDSNLRLGVTLLFFLWNIFVASRLETAYPETLVELYALPITRMLILGLVMLSSLWCPKVAIMVAFAFVCLGADVIFLTRTP
jgi:hypothetical protein